MPGLYLQIYFITRFLVKDCDIFDLNSSGKSPTFSSLTFFKLCKNLSGFSL